uniref:Uncharacterized protein n=1 Tax=Knipowitschia caucasica TaxID=637954 RepID=A0AAV2KNQ5_KNICA
MLTVGEGSLNIPLKQSSQRCLCFICGCKASSCRVLPAAGEPDKVSYLKVREVNRLQQRRGWSACRGGVGGWGVVRL